MTASLRRISLLLAVAFLFGVPVAQAQCVATTGDGCFKKGALLINLTEGGTHADYLTRSAKPDGSAGQHALVDGDRDPLIIEYAATKHWGFGLTFGTDIFDVNPQMYGFTTASGYVQAFMSEVTADAHYHFLVTKKIDLSVFGAFGMSSVMFKGNEGDKDYQYNGGGGIIRAGGTARYYLGRRLSVVGMFSVFNCGTSPDKKKVNTTGLGYNTTITGHAYEFGICYRVLR